MTCKLPLAESAARRLPVASLLFVALAAALYALPGASDCLQYDRTAILHGEVWRVLTGHLVHWSGNQFFWDGLALAFLGWLCEREGIASSLRCFVFSAFLISLTLWFAAPWMATYRGLSGIDSALFALVAVRLGREAFADREWMKLTLVGIVAGGFALKVGYEFASGATLFVDSSAGGMIPVPLAHVVGAMVGVGCGLMPGVSQRSRPSIAKWWNSGATGEARPSGPAHEAGGSLVSSFSVFVRRSSGIRTGGSKPPPVAPPLSSGSPSAPRPLWPLAPHPAP
jgi:rhomboid family GlyGly-CTERM serine protease